MHEENMRHKRQPVQVVETKPMAAEAESVIAGLDKAMATLLGRIEALEKGFNGYKSGRKTQQGQRQGTRRQLPRFTEDGSPICFLCGQAGHMRRSCPKAQGNDRPL